MPLIFRSLSIVFALAGGMLLLVIIAVTTINVVCFGLDRLVRLADFRVPGLPGYEDLVRLLISSAALLFFPFCQLRRGHVQADLLNAMLSDRAKSVLDRVAALGTAALALFLAYWMGRGMVETWRDGVSSPVLGWAEWPFYFSGICALLLWSAIAAWQGAFGSGSPSRRSQKGGSQLGRSHAGRIGCDRTDNDG